MCIVALCMLYICFVDILLANAPEASSLSIGLHASRPVALCLEAAKPATLKLETYRSATLGM